MASGATPDGTIQFEYGCDADASPEQLTDTLLLAAKARESQGDCEHEVTFGGEADLHKSFKRCKKNPGHKNFIHLKDFTSKHLPEEYQKDEDVLSLVKTQAEITCCIRIRHVSKDRPDKFPGTGAPYPFSRYRGRSDFERTGTGWVKSVEIFTEEDKNDEDYIPCPCQPCRESENPKSEWADIRIMTATHLVCDEDEARRAICYFLYDDTDKKVTECPALKGWVREVDSYSDDDSSEISYAVHDLEWANQLCDAWNRCWDLGVKLRHKYRPDWAEENSSDDEIIEDDEEIVFNESDYEAKEGEAIYYDPALPLTIITSHPHGSSMMVSVGKVIKREQDPVEFIYSYYRYTNPTCRGSSGAPIFILGRRGDLYFASHPHSQSYGRLKGGAQVNRSARQLY